VGIFAGGPYEVAGSNIKSAPLAHSETVGGWVIDVQVVAGSIAMDLVDENGDMHNHPMVCFCPSLAKLVYPLRLLQRSHSNVEG
jgi:hypothetical protein